MMLFNLFVCGSGSFGHDDGDDSLLHPRSRKKNPYSTRGLDKFATVLADLEEKRRKIYGQLGSKDSGLLVKFGYNDKGWVPIVVKLRGRGGDQKDDHNKAMVKHVDEHKPKFIEEVRRSNHVQRGRKTNLFRVRDSCYWYVVVVIILVCLALYGRSFAITCTCIWWYLVPSVKGEGAGLRRFTKNESFVRKLRIETVNNASKSQNMSMRRTSPK